MKNEEFTYTVLSRKWYGRDEELIFEHPIKQWWCQGRNEKGYTTNYIPYTAD